MASLVSINLPTIDEIHLELLDYWPTWERYYDNEFHLGNFLSFHALDSLGYHFYILESGMVGFTGISDLNISIKKWFDVECAEHREFVKIIMTDSQKLEFKMLYFS